MEQYRNIFPILSPEMNIKLKIPSTEIPLLSGNS